MTTVPHPSSQPTTAPLQISVTQQVNASPTAVWEVLRQHQLMTSWMPLINRVDPPSVDGVGSERVCNFGGDELHEKIVDWQPGVGYAYRIQNKAGRFFKDHLGRFTIEAQEDGTSLVRWEQYFRPNGLAPLAWMMRKQMMPRLMRKALRNLDSYLSKA
ncbi:MAG: SRPBCC family protein [Bacteroidota bacterium]